MANKLTDITTSYSTFAKDQILTETQLNEFLEYFDEQDRLSRICLSGVGIACGFELSTDSKTNAITISQGAGVTTDGDLIHLVAKEKLKGKKKEVNPDNLKDILVDKIKYEYYRTYDSEDVKYHPHFNKYDGIKDFDQIPLVEIVSNADKRPTDANLQTLDLKNKIALFYLECYPKDPDTCVTVNCENQGIEQVNKLRVLLVDITYIDRITRTDNLFNSYITMESYLETQTVYVPRVILNKDNTATAPALADEYQDTALINSAVANIRSGMNTILQRLDRASEAKTFSSNMRRIFPTNEPTNLILFQYKYDVLKDLADSYNELKELFLQNYATCCPNIAAFPKHLLLGSPYEARENSGNLVSNPISEPIFVSDGDASLGKRLTGPVLRDDRSYRHKFHKSPILLDSDEGNGRFESVLTRILTMVSDQGFYDSKEFRSEIIRITPSNERVPLGKRAVPFYYRFNNELMINWDFDKSGYDRYKSILGYRQASAYPYNPYVSNPLRFSLDPYDFYRIEGHQGHPYDQVFESLTQLKESFSLPFDIKVLGINVTEFDELLADQYKCEFKDLGVLLEAWSKELKCIAEEVVPVVSSFSTVTPGANTKVIDYFGLAKKTNLSNVEGLSKAEELSFGLSDAPKAAGRSYMAFGTEAESSSGTKESAAPVNSILNFISNEPDTVGYFVNKAIADSKGNYGTATVFALNDIESLVSEWDGNIARSTTKLPAKITLACTQLIELLPNSIKELTDTTLDSYNAQIKVLCDYTKQLKSDYQDEERISVVDQDTRVMTSFVINQLASICCSSKKLTALLEELTARKNSIIERLNFKNFALKNPGLEHKAGAGPGQTFVIVYLNDAITENTDGLSSGIGTIPGLINPISPSAPLTPVKGVVGNNPAIGAVSGSFTNPTASFGMTAGTTPMANTKLDGSELTAFTSLTGDVSHESSAKKAIIGAGQPTFTNTLTDLTIDDGLLLDPNIFIKSTGNKVIIPKGAVIADFTLPYLCCSDCAPISFVLPNIPVSLTLSENTYCIDGSNKEIDLTVMPEDGIITVVDAVPGVDITDNKLSIDGSIFPDEFLGSIIKFKVDGEDTDAELLVSKKPNVDFNIPDVGVDRLVSFTVTGEDSTELTYLWDFGDGQTSTEREPTHDYSGAGAQQNFIVTFTVQGIGGICPTVVSRPLNFKNVEVESLGNISVCEGTEPIPFVITPDGAFADIQGEGLNPEKTHFDPELTGTGSFPLTFQGGSIGIITVNPKPVFLSSTKKVNWKTNTEKNSVEFSVEVAHATDYLWTVIPPEGSEKTVSTKDLSISQADIEKYSPGDIFKVSVVVSNACGELTSLTLDWLVPDPKEATAQLEQVVFCIDNSNPIEFIVENFTENTEISGPGVDSTVSPPTFTPSVAGVGTHDIIVDGVVTDTAIVVEKPALGIQPIVNTSTGFSLVAVVPPAVDESTLVWKFLAPNDEPLHDPILGKATTPVNFEDFSTNEWTQVNIVLAGESEPCDPVRVSVPFTKDVSVGLETLEYCEDDPNSYNFTFVPDDGSVFFKGEAGASKDGRSFNPGELDPGTYTLTASNGKSLVVTVYARPSIPAPTVSLNTAGTGIDVTTVFPPNAPVSNVVWTFRNSESNEVLHQLESGEDLSVDFADFNSQSWTILKVEVTADIGPCLGVSSSTLHEKPEEETVVVSLVPSQYCKGDTRETFFTYDPNTPVPITGPETILNALNEDGTGFFPNLMPVGSSTFIAENGQPVLVEIIEPDFGSLNPHEHIAATNTLKLSYQETGEVTTSAVWQIGTEKGGVIAQSSDNPWNVSLQELDAGTGTVLNYSLLLSSEFCGNKTYNDSFTVPPVVSACVNMMVGALDILDSEKPTPSQLKKQLVDDGKISEVLIVYTLLNDLRSKPNDVLSGSMNDRIATELHAFVNFLSIELRTALKNDNTASLNMLAKLYRMVVEIYALTFYCQGKVDFETFTTGSAFNSKLRRHFNPKSQTSLIRSGITIFNTSNRGRLEPIISDKGEVDEPWATIDFVIYAIDSLG